MHWLYHLIGITLYRALLCHMPYCCRGLFTELSSVIPHAVGSTQLSRHQQQYSLVQSLEELAGLAETAKVKVGLPVICILLPAGAAVLYIQMLTRMRQSFER